MKRTKFLRTCVALLFLVACNFARAFGPTPETPGSTSIAPPGTANRHLVADEYLTDVSMVSHDPFDNMRKWKFQEGTGALTDGTFQLRGTPLWHSNFWLKQPFGEGQGLMLTFKVQQANAQSEFVFVTGKWLTGTFRQYGVYNAVIPRGDLFQGTSNLGGYDLISSLNLRPNTWYSLLLAIGRRGHFLAVVWDPGNERLRAVYDLVGGDSWANRNWLFFPKANEGETVSVDEFYRITFGDIK